jgi:hypothetical protein
MAGGALGPGESFVLCDTSDYDQARRRPAATAPCCPPPAIFRDLLCYLVVWCSGDRACRPGAAKLHAAPQSPPAPPGGPHASGITPRRGAGAGGVRGHGRRGAPRGPLARAPPRSHPALPLLPACALGMRLLSMVRGREALWPRRPTRTPAQTGRPRCCRATSSGATTAFTRPTRPAVLASSTQAPSMLSPAMATRQPPPMLPPARHIRTARGRFLFFWGREGD